ncbi:MAG: hypothetical protein Q4B70_07435 [Lachnospiraceae bacterium]|nr:hypothetical protein [Lachnospiraceae bacterium]
MRNIKFGFKKTAVMVAAFCMTMSIGQTAFAASDAEYTKNENVYVRLAQDGEVDGTYVVNTFDVTEEGEITDYGDYSKIQNLTNLEAIEQDKEEQTFTAEEGKFHYQGDMDKAELPWNFDITYYLDDDEVEEEELEGAEGDLRMKISVKENPSYTNDKFFKAYMLQITASLDTDLCENIKAKDGTITDAGSNEQISFTVNPGKEKTMEITADVTDFEMDDISIAAVPTNDLEKSFASKENDDHMGKTSFIISAEGVTIPDEEAVVPEETEEEGFVDKLRSLF